MSKRLNKAGQRHKVSLAIVAGFGFVAFFRGARGLAVMAQPGWLDPAAYLALLMLAGIAVLAATGTLIHYMGTD